MSFNFGDKIKISIFGKSHSEEIGVTIEGLPTGFKVDEEKLSSFMLRRAPGRDKFSTPRKEADKVEIISHTPLRAIIRNTNRHSSDYDNLKAVPRPGHADFAAYSKYGIDYDMTGGGEFSGRLTAPLCIAGGICKQLLEEKGIHIGAHIASIGNTEDDRFNPVTVNENDFVHEKEFPVINDAKGEEMKKEILTSRSEGNSIGGTVECVITGIPAGVGNTFFGSWESAISSAMFAIPAVKGIEFGLGFESSKLRGNENNDAFIIKNGKVVTETNNHGGILGGIASGMPIVFRVAFKPTPSISKEQKSVSLSKMEEVPLIINGRHDPCIVKRAVPCVEAAAAIVAANIIL